jgi:raffinose/stachyose/melibiose transport system substrate-binding protein
VSVTSNSASSPGTGDRRGARWPGRSGRGAGAAKPGRARRRLAAAAGLASVAALLAACGGGGTGHGGSATSADITWWGWTPSVPAANQYIKLFNKQYPNIHVTYKMLTIAGYNAALRPALASSVGPDVFDVAPGAANGSVEEYGVDAVNLEPAVKKALGSGWQSKLAPIGVSSMETGGKLVGMSVGSVFAGSIWINQNLFNKYHLTAPKTLPQWVSDCKVFKAHGVGCFVQGVSQTAFNEDTLQAISDDIQPGLWTKEVTGKASFSNPVMVKTLSIWKQFFSDGIMENGALGVQQYPDADNAFLAQKDAMVMMGTWYMQYDTVSGMDAAISGAGVASPKPFPAVAIPFPDVAGSGNPATLYGDADYGLAVNAKSSHINAATTFAIWLGTSKAGQQLVANVLNDIPALNGVHPDWSNIKLVDPSVQQPVLDNLITKAGLSHEPRLANVSANLQTAIGVASTTVAAGSKTPQQAASILQATALKLR